MPQLVDTTIRLLGQDPLADVVPAADLYRLAEILDKAGFAFLEVSGARKAATLETGLVVQVPLFVNIGDRVKVDTRSSDYLSRA